MEGDDRQALATRLGYSETVFVDDAAAGRIAIYTPDAEMPFAGHPTVGTAWLLAAGGVRVDALRTSGRGGRGALRRATDAYVAARPEWCPPFELRGARLVAAAVEAHPGVEEGDVYVWAWIDEEAGLVRARSFVPATGIPEDEATGLGGAAALPRAGPPDRGPPGPRLGDHARPVDDGMVEIGGLVVDDLRPSPAVRCQPASGLEPEWACFRLHMGEALDRLRGDGGRLAYRRERDPIRLAGRTRDMCLG